MIEELDQEPDKLTKPHFEDNELGTGETIVHLLAREGCVETLRSILNVHEKPRIQQSEVVKALLMLDNAGWSPLMSAIKADQNGEEIIEMFLDFINRECVAEDMNQIIGTNEDCDKVLFKLSIYTGIYELGHVITKGEILLLIFTECIA